MPTFGEFLSLMDVAFFFQKLSLLLLRRSYDFYLPFVNVICHTDLLAGAAPPGIPEINPSWSWCMTLLMYCWIWFASILLRSFVSVFISDIGLLTSFFCLSGLVAGWWCLPLQFLGRVLEESVYYCCCSATKSCLTLGHSTDCSPPGFSVPHHLPEFAQVHIYWISDAFQPSHPLLLSSPSAFNLSQHQGLF